MKQVKLQPRQHTILFSDEELDVIQAALVQLAESDVLKYDSRLVSAGLKYFQESMGTQIDITGQEPCIPEVLLQGNITYLASQIRELIED